MVDRSSRETRQTECLDERMRDDKVARIEVASEKIESNNALVLEAFDTLFNKRDYARAETFRRSTSGIARTSSQGAKDSEDRKLRDQAVNCVSQLRGIVEVRWCPFFRSGCGDSVRFVFRM